MKTNQTIALNVKTAAETADELKWTQTTGPCRQPAAHPSGERLSSEESAFICVHQRFSFFPAKAIAGFALSLAVAALAGSLCIMPASTVSAAEDGFALFDPDGEALEVRIDGRPVARYMYLYDPVNRRDETFKPFLHILDPGTGEPITKAHEGQFCHHRGIFVGWNRLGFEGNTYDFWHMRRVEQVHQSFSNRVIASDRAELTSVVEWIPRDQDALVQEHRTMVFRRLPAPGIVLVDLEVRLNPVRGDIRLRGDPEHAGVQYRPHQDVIAAETQYFFSRENADPKEDTDYRWVGQTHTIGGQRYSVVHMNHPKNPAGTLYSAYRDYGRFGAFFETDIKAGESLTLHYRFAITQGGMFPETKIDDLWQDFTGPDGPSAQQ